MNRLPLNGTVAATDKALHRADFTDATSSPANRPFGLHPLSIPAGDHRARRPLVSPVRTLLEELLAERGIEVDHVTIYRWVQRFTPLQIDAAHPCRHAVGNRWFVDETYVKVSGTWRYVYRAVDQHGQVIDIYVSRRRNIPAARTFLKTTLLAHDKPVEVVTDLAQALETVIEEQLPRAFHNTAQYANNRVECDPGRLKSRLRPMRGLKTDRTASIVIRGHAFIQNLRRGHYELGTEASHQHFRIAEAFDELVDLI